jgi:hypothetical protein
VAPPLLTHSRMAEGLRFRRARAWYLYGCRTQGAADEPPPSRRRAKLDLPAAIAARLEEDPALLVTACRRVAHWIELGTPHPHYALAWEEILGSSVSIIKARLVDPSEKGRELRQVTPFAGLIGPRERWRIWSEVRRDHFGVGGTTTVFDGVPRSPAG